MSVGIAGMGFYVPEQRRTNQMVVSDIREALKGTDSDWLNKTAEDIVRVSGIKERRIAAKNEPLSDMAAEAARRAIRDAGMHPEDIDAMLLATLTGDCVTPAAACYVQEKVGLRNLKILPGDFNGACAGMVGAMRMAKAIIKDEDDPCENALVIGAERISSLIDPHRPESYILFGDGAAAVILKEHPRMKLLKFIGGGDGSKTEVIKKTQNGSLGFLGGGIFKFAVQKLPEVTHQLLESIGKNLDDLALLIPHQANLRIIESARIRLGLPKEKVFVNLDKYGNTSAPSGFIALCEAREQKRFKEGDLVAIIKFGAGLVWEGCLIEA